MAITWIRATPIRLEAKADNAKHKVELFAVNVGGSDESKLWCIHVDGGCHGIEVKGLSKAKLIGARYIFGCLEVGK